MPRSAAACRVSAALHHIGWMLRDQGISVGPTASRRGDSMPLIQLCYSDLPTTPAITRAPYASRAWQPSPIIGLNERQGAATDHRGRTEQVLGNECDLLSVTVEKNCAAALEAEMQKSTRVRGRRPSQRGRVNTGHSGWHLRNAGIWASHSQSRKSVSWP